MPAVTLTRISNTVVLAWGWRRAAIACAAGAVSTLAMAPFYAWPLLFLTFPVLVWLIDGAAAGRWGRAMSAAIVGWWFGLGYFVTGLYWIGIAFLVDAKTFAWLMPFAVLGLPALLALFTGLGTALAGALWTPGPARVFALAASLTAAEWLRGHALSGFPWNAFGYALTAPLALAQSAAVVGLWGLTFLAVAIFASPAVLCDDRADTPRPLLLPSAALALLALMAIYGAARLSVLPTTFVDGVKLRIMQPNLPQDKKFNYGAKAEVMRRYVTLSARQNADGSGGDGLRGVTHLIWPESAFPFLLTREPDALAQIANLLPANAVLITGAARGEPPAAPGRGFQAYNAIYVIGRGGSIVDVYDKTHLVPFGEYLPAQSVLEKIGLQQLTKVHGGFLAGNRRRLLNVLGTPPALPLICYEIIFPGAAVPAGPRPGWMLNLTNDGWFGNSTGPYQHFQQARVRAIEEGLPLVRGANTGISAVVDPLGRVIAALPLGAEAVLDAALPKPVDPPLYVMMGDSGTLLLVGAALLFCLQRRLRRR